MDDNTNPHPVPSIDQMRAQHGMSRVSTGGAYQFGVIPGDQVPAGTFENAGALQAPPPEIRPDGIQLVPSANFEFLGETYRGKPITQGQLSAVAMSLEAGGRVMLDTLRLVLSSAVGDENWKIMFTALASGTADMDDLMKVVNQLAPKSDA
jgi:hypothetical protein